MPEHRRNLIETIHNRPERVWEDVSLDRFWDSPNIRYAFCFHPRKPSDKASGGRDVLMRGDGIENGSAWEAKHDESEH